MERGRQKERERGGGTSGWRTTEFMIPEVFTVQGSMTAHLHTHYIVWCMVRPKEIRQLNVCDSLIFFVFVFPSPQKWWWCVCNSWYCWGGNVHGLNRMWHKALHNLWWTVTPAFPHIVTWLFINRKYLYFIEEAGFVSLHLSNEFNSSDYIVKPRVHLYPFIHWKFCKILKRAPIQALILPQMLLPPPRHISIGQ